MSCFACAKCNCVENTATSNYWEGSRLCSACDPDIGVWHGKFDRQSAAGLLLGNDGFLYSKKEVDNGSLKFRMFETGFNIIKEVRDEI